MSFPTFTIAIPAYKAQFLHEAIQSVLGQTFADFELVIVNDASPEDLGAIVKSYADPRIRYFVNEKNCGAVDVVDNWNHCLSHATGTYFLCMGDDDRLLPTCLADYKGLIAQHPGLGIYHAWTQIIDDQGDIVRMQAPRPEVESVYSLIWNRWKGRDQFVGDFLFDTARLKMIGGFFKLPYAWGSDDITAVMAAEPSGIANLQVPAFQYRAHAATISESTPCDQFMQAIDLEEAWFTRFLTDHAASPVSPLTAVFRKMCVATRAEYFSNRRQQTVANDLEAHGILRLLYWMRPRHRHGLRLSQICFCGLLSIRQAFHRRRIAKQQDYIP